MKKERYALLCALFVLATFTSSAQQIKTPFKHFDASTNFKAFYSTPTLSLTTTNALTAAPFINPFETGVHYNAFFCKLEVENLKRFNIWIKFHAADYDKYSSPNH